MCCERQLIPLRLAFALTVHRCQGLSAGTTKEGQPPNAIQRIVLDVGQRGFEALCPGTAYTGFSRATTLGGSNVMESALFFIGENLNPSRLMNMSQYTKQNKTLLRIRRRNNWVSLLTSNKHSYSVSQRQIDSIFAWANTNRMSKSDVETLLYQSRKSNTKFE